MALAIFQNQAVDNSDERMFAELVKLLAEENIVTVIDPAFKTASFDLVKRIICIPLWKNMDRNTKAMLRFHECSHALFSDAKSFHDFIRGKYGPVLSGIINICEDDRVDRKMINRFPGARVHYREGYKYLLNKFWSKVNVETLSLADKFNLDSKAKEHFPFVAQNDEERDLYIRFKTTSTIEEVIQLAKDILAYIRKNKEEEKSHTDTHEPTPGNNDGEEQDQDQDSQGGEGESQEGEEQEESDSAGGEEQEGEASDSQEGEQGESKEGDEGENQDGMEGETDEGSEQEQDTDSQTSGEGHDGEENYAQTQDLFDQQTESEQRDAQEPEQPRKPWERSKDPMDGVVILRGKPENIIGVKRTRDLINRSLGRT